MSTIVRSRRALRWLSGVTAGLVAMSLAPVAQAAAGGAAQTFHYKEFSQGANVVFSPNCPFGDWTPAVDTVCDTWTVWYVRFDKSVDGGPIDRSGAPFHAEVDHEVDLVHPDGSGVTLTFEVGTAPVDGTYDAAHLSAAHMVAVTVGLNTVDPDTGQLTPTGRSASLSPFTWTAASGTYEWGNDGPAFGGGPRHLSTRCETTNQLAHQKDTVGYVSGSLDGVPISADYQLVQIPGLTPADGTGYIFNNWFHIDDVTRCSA